MAITLTVNGTPQNFDGDPEMPLLWVLRDQFRMTGTKFGCGAGLCGACTVMIGGAAQRSCQVTAKDAGGQNITTIEGLNGKVADAVRKAWQKLDVVQCGYCQSGQVVSATALLSQVSWPNDEDINKAMDGNICRCATYHRIRAAIHEAAATMDTSPQP